MLEIGKAGRGDVGYWLLAQARGRGYATRALRLLALWAISDVGVARAQLWVATDNIRSQRVAERAGFRREGVLRSYGRRPDGSRVDAAFYALIPADLVEERAPRATAARVRSMRMTDASDVAELCQELGYAVNAKEDEHG